MQPRKLRPLRTVEVDITALSKKGDGKGLAILQPEDKTVAVEVPFTLIGDKVQATLLRKEKGFYQSRLEAILAPAPQRIAPKCIHFGSCGGCRLQHLSYDDQLLQKEQLIKNIFAAHLSPQVVFHPILPCLPPWQYRNKMEFSFSSDRAGNRYLGLVLQGGKGRVFNLQECHLVNPWFVQALHTVKHWWEESKLEAYHPYANTGSLRTLIVREGKRTGDRLVMLTVSGNPDFALNKLQLDHFRDSLRHAIAPLNPGSKLSIFLRIQQILKGTPTQFYEMLLYGPDHIREELHIQEVAGDPPYNVMFKISPSAFFQPNSEQAEQLYSRALQMIKIPPDALVYDLYCGTGTLGICAARQARHVIGIELSPESALDARENVKANGLHNVQILEGDVGKVLASLAGQPDVVMVDPPRSGLDAKAIEHLLNIKAPKLLYISCNPITQAANLEQLIGGGYRLEALQSVDQFPQTMHVENIAVLHFCDSNL
jgi:23S rRNA (uracil1939-C5)-methyltransferase